MSDVRLVRWTFLRLLGAIFLIAFVSLWMQIHGLVGANGILPVGPLIDQARQYVDANHIGIDRYRLLPTLSWFGQSDGWLTGQCATGAALSVLLIADVAPALCLAALWLLYLSLSVAGQDFLGFQWDALLLETGFLAIVLAPWRMRPGLKRDLPVSGVALWLLRWLLFRLVFESGCVKLLSGDTSWRHLTALTEHYQTQPLPTWIGWYAHQLPEWIQRGSCAVMFGIELGAPFLIFGPRRVRAIGAAVLAGFQMLILLTGNYTFFNWLTIALCVLLLDDRFLALAWSPRVVQSVAARPEAVASPRSGAWSRVAAIVVACVVVPVSASQLVQMFGVSVPLAGAAQQWLAPLRTINSYGLFAIMTTTRNEIVVEGSDDGVEWRAYEFNYKPGDVMGRPAFVAPLQPRLDWQMWFAALGAWRDNPWFSNFAVKLLQGAPAVTALLRVNPFAQHPPHYLRARLFEYRFTTFEERRRTGAWWSRSPTGDYMRAISLR